MSITANQIYNTREKFHRFMPNRGFSRMLPQKIEIFQSEFLAELDPNGHKINDKTYYENIFKEIPILDSEGVDTGKKQTIEIPIERVAVPMQEVIRNKHLTHLAGEKIKFIQHNLNPSEEEINTFVGFKQGWEKKNMETAKYEFMKSVKSTGDGAFCAVMTNNKFSYRVFSVLNGDTLHPIRDFHGKVKLFGRSFTSYDYEKEEDVLYMEVWDDKYYTLLAQNKEGNSREINIKWDSSQMRSILSEGDDEWYVVDQNLHGFKRIPIVYLKDEKGACWSAVQDLIDKLELALSQLFENNKAYAFQIMIVKGDVEIQGDLRGQARAMMFDDKDGGAELLGKADHANSFELQLKETLKHILLGSFTVLPPDNISGDLSGIAMKIRYSPAIEQGLNDKNFFNAAIDDIIELFKEGYGIEQGKPSDYSILDIRGDIQIYVHQNDNEITNNLVLLTQAEILSKDTAREVSGYSAADESSRMSKQKEQDIEDERAEIIRETKTQVDNDGMNDTNLERQLLARDK